MNKCRIQIVEQSDNTFNVQGNLNKGTKKFSFFEEGFASVDAAWNYCKIIIVNKLGLGKSDFDEITKVVQTYVAPVDPVNSTNVTDSVEEDFTEIEEE